MDKVRSKSVIDNVLNRYASQVPGLQHIITNEDCFLFEYAGGWADIQNQKLMTPDTTMMGYSMTKVFTATAILQLVEQEKLELSDEMDHYLADTPYAGHHITIRQLLDHTSGIRNPIPLRWVHLVDDDVNFDEDAALAQVLHDNPKLAFEPGQKFAYSNIGYWLLGKLIERVTGEPYTDYVRANILSPLGLLAQEMNFAIPDPGQHANGYLAKYSLMNLGKGFVTDRKFWGGYEGDWLRIKSHYPNGPAFGGLVGTARGFAYFLQDQLRAESLLLEPETKRLLETQQTDKNGQPIPMTLGWHIGGTNSSTYFFKEGGGGGFHSEMRIYPRKGIASIVMANSTTFDATSFLNQMDGAFLSASS